MPNFAEYLDAMVNAPRDANDPVLHLARAWASYPHGKIRSVSGVRKWFDDHKSEISPELVERAMPIAVREYTAIRDGAQAPAPTANSDLAEWMASINERLAGIEQALVWLVDAEAGRSAAQQAQIDARSVQDYRDWAGGDQTRSEAAALGLVTPAPGRTSGPQRTEPSSQPGYEHVLPPTGIIPRNNSGDQQSSTTEDHPLAHAMGLDADPALAAQREAIAAEAERIQAASPPEAAYYDESAQVQQVAPAEGGSYSPEQWRAWAMTSDIPGDEPEA
jgi:hypothetical protein